MEYRPVPQVVTHQPMQVRFFRERDIQALQDAVNKWLAERRDREIAHVRQSVGIEGELVVSVWYVEG